MDVALPLEKMSVEDKLRVLERVWEDLLRAPTGIPSPAWHRDVLEAREKRIGAGQERFIPWEAAKEEIRSKKP